MKFINGDIMALRKGLFEKDFVLEIIDEYDTVEGMDKKNMITIQDVIDNHEIHFYPEHCPEYYATFRSVEDGRIQKIINDLTKGFVDNEVEYYYYL